jgi:gamma-glutamyltranspeptidase/glutathione hydrolase
MVAAQHRGVAEVGADVLEAGGDAVDAAVAASFAASVLEPWMSGPLGGGAMLVWRKQAQRTDAIAFNPVSPRQLDPSAYPLARDGGQSDMAPWQMVAGDRNAVGPLSIATPGLVAGLGLAHSRYGRLPWSALLQPAAAAARRGLLLDWYASLIIASKARSLAADPDAADLFLEDGGWPKIAAWTAVAEQRVKMPAAAATLDRLAEAGPQDFYRGDIARALTADAERKGAVINRGDLESYAASIGPALTCQARTGRFALPPGLTGGPTFADARQRLDALAAHAPDPLDHRAALLTAQDRRLASMGHAATAGTPDCTSHISVADRDGNLVALTQTLLSPFGACVLSPSTGFLFNNGILWFDPEPGRPNSLAPARTCLMNVCPVIGTGPQGRFALGASGGRKIVPAVFQIASFLTDLAQPLGTALAAPRIDPVRWDLTIADPRLPAETIARLRSVTTVLPVPSTAFPSSYACAVGVMHTANGGFEGCADIMSPWADAAAPSG